jgi:hypothetical protein
VTRSIRYYWQEPLGRTQCFDTGKTQSGEQRSPFENHYARLTGHSFMGLGTTALLPNREDAMHMMLHMVSLHFDNGADC